MNNLGNDTRTIKILSDLVATVVSAQNPQIVWMSAGKAFNELIGHQLFTILGNLEASGEVVRLYSNRPDEYPVDGLKPMGPTPWGDLVLKQGDPFIGNDRASIKWAFPDHELIISMGLGSVLNLPMIHAGKVIGTINLLHKAGHYRQDHLLIGQIIAALLVPGLALHKTEYPTIGP